MAAPNDVSALERAFASGAIRAERIVCIHVKTEGNGLDNDYSRPLAIDAIGRSLSSAGRAEGVTLFVSGGCEGFISPHMLVVETGPVEQAGDNGSSLAVGRAVTRKLLPEEVGNAAQSDATQEAVAAALADAELEPHQAELVQVKAAVLMPEHIEDALERGVEPCARDTHASKGPVRAASARGVMMALGERGPHSEHAFITPGATELRSEVVVFGNSRRWHGRQRVGVAVLKDLLDAVAIRRAMEGIATAEAVLFKGEPSRSGRIRGERHVMWRDSDINAVRHMRAAVGGVLALALGTTRIFAVGGAEYQAPDGGGILAVFGPATMDARS